MSAARRVRVQVRCDAELRDGRKTRVPVMDQVIELPTWITDNAEPERVWCNVTMTVVPNEEPV